jgi:hypothetical protein
MLMVPEGYRIRHVGVQDDRACLWAQVFTNSPLVPLRLRIVGTGHPIDFFGEYVGTVQMPPFVWHIFREPAP